ncbi:tRNA (cytidine/uridine-2'-O-)-methyltransferase TrmJ [Candidatus Pandoraea novymonadis]|uniref:tRNA (cytidine/uridine-2'-O-)-methyltransferase TrmJ n=1 Tax=Candidatus Pandoraea novymonadis TaxID=1808959 RepID=A0ABX5FE28_9BURK|nr:tRNA (cytidine/uridine-2'-O-)-methyltransferase TrmJ [Candidatus Pandoraea novymonadis]
MLHKTSHPGNIGAAARAIKTMGFGRLVLANPNGGPAVLNDPEAIAFASGAVDVLTTAVVTPDLVTALNDVHFTIALTARTREYGPPYTLPRESAEFAVQQASMGAVIAFIFGCERTGLLNVDVERCNLLVHIPTGPMYSSLNLSQAVQLIAYEVGLACGSAPVTKISSLSRKILATHDDVEGMLLHFERALIDLGFLDPVNPQKLMTRLRCLFARSNLEQEEVNILRGISKHILERKIVK